jgi:putative DNA primase/helicase
MSCILDARNVATALGGRAVGRYRVIAPGPGHSRKDKSLSVRLDDRAPDGFIVYSFGADTWQDCRAHVLQRLGLPAWRPGNGKDHQAPASRVVDAAEERWTEDEIKRINWARVIWRDAVNPAGTLAETYLGRRKIDLDAGLAGKVVRFHPAAPWYCEDAGQTIRVPALIAAFRQIDDNTITGIQRVRLNPDGSKQDRHMLGVVAHAAIKLGMPNSGELAVGEGVETALAAMQLGFKPAWALGSCGGVSRFPIVDGVKQLTLLGENDSASAGATKVCGERWLRAGREVRVVMPDDACNDLNDELIARTAP